jgi:hypothetical protein
VKPYLKKSLVLAAMLIAFMCITQVAQAQQKRRVIQLSGVVIEDDSVNGRPVSGVHVYVPKAGRGTTTNNVGFFSMPVLTGDEILISSVGYQHQNFTVPDNSPEYQTIIITLVQDTTILPEVLVVQFPTEEVFKQAVLALNVPLNENITKENLNQELLALMLKTTPMDGYQNQRYYLNQWASHATDKYQPVSNPFLNPFNWVKFFNSLKKSNTKKKR